MSIQNEEIADIWKKEKLAWDSKDKDRIINALLGSRGFGYRTLAWRDSSANTEEQMRLALEQWFKNMEYLRHIEMDDLNTWSEGDIGLAWGFYTEEFQHKGQTPEKVRIRFTSTYKKEGEEWRLLMYHKEIQPFNEEGYYPKELTRIE